MCNMRLTQRQRSEIVQLYRKAMVSEIAAMFCVSRVTVFKVVRAAGVDTSRAPVSVECSRCGTKFTRRRWSVARSRSLFCSAACYRLALKDTAYRPNRNGQRVARTVVRAYFPGLSTLQVVHHVDGDCKNNRAENLMVFRNQADHLRWHRLGRESSGVRPVWP